jgi:hypothetical protein
LMRIKLFIPFMHARKGKKIITPSKLTIIYKASKVVNIIIIIISIPLHCPMEKKEGMNECSSNLCTTTHMINPSIRTHLFPFFLRPFCHDNHTNLPYLVCHIHHSSYTTAKYPFKKKTLTCPFFFLKKKKEKRRKRRSTKNFERVLLKP